MDDGSEIKEGKAILKGKWIPINILKNTLTVNLQDKHTNELEYIKCGREYIGNMLLHSLLRVRIHTNNSKAFILTH